MHISSAVQELVLKDLLWNILATGTLIVLLAYFMKPVTNSCGLHVTILITFVKCCSLKCYKMFIF